MGLGLFARSNSRASNTPPRNDSPTTPPSTTPFLSFTSSRNASGDELDRFFKFGFTQELNAETRTTPALVPETTKATPIIPPHDPATVPWVIPPRIPSKKISTESAGRSRSNSLAKQLLEHGRRLAASSSKTSVSSSESDFTGSAAHNSKVPLQDAGRSQKAENPLSRSRSISTPTEFQHMTHIGFDDYQKLKTGTQSDLVADFSALRAAQHQRRDFRGIKTVELHSRESSVETTSASVTPSDRSSMQFTPDTSATSSTRSSVQKIESPVRTMSHTRKRSLNSFSQPFVNGRPPKIVTAGICAPPRTSSMRATTRTGQTPRSYDRDAAIGPPPSVAPSPPQATQESSSESDDIAEESSDDAYGTSEPSSPTRLSTLRPLAPCGQALSDVDEEEVGRATPPLGPNAMFRTSSTTKRSRREASICLAPSSASSSDDSNGTLTAARFADKLGRQDCRVSTLGSRSSVATLASSSASASSQSGNAMSHGLFTAWSLDDLDFDELLEEEEEDLDDFPVQECKPLSLTLVKPKSTTTSKELTVLPSSTYEPPSRAKHAKRTSGSSQRSSTSYRASQPPPTRQSPKVTSKASFSKHSRHNSEPTSSHSKDAMQAGKKRASAC